MVRAVILSDRSLREAIASGRVIIEPFDDGMVQPSSIDVRVDRLFRVFRNHTAGVIDVKQDLSALTELVEIGDDGVFMLHPGEFVLGSTLERVAVPDDLVARIEGKALSIDTPLPTPDGWTTIGDVSRRGGGVQPHRPSCACQGRHRGAPCVGRVTRSSSPTDPPSWPTNRTNG